MKRYCSLILFLLFVVCGWSKDVIPPVPNPPRLVNDFAHILTDYQIAEKETKLVAFNDTTTNVICVVTVNDLGEYSAAEFAYEIGQKWDVRSKEKRNGVILLIKPRNETAGAVYISVGYDLEPAIPDITAGKIIDYKMMPSLRKGDYNSAIDSALAYILPLAAGEISEIRDYDKPKDLTVEVGILTLIIIVALLIFISKIDKKNSSNGHNPSGRVFYEPTVFHGNIWSDFGGGRSSGGFGGFGGGLGGGFGGGGAGRRF